MVCSEFEDVERCAGGLVNSLENTLFFNINGSGLGHMNRCLAYARAVEPQLKPVFFSLASAIETIEGFGFEAEYFVSPYWSDTAAYVWNSELAVRFGMVLEQVKPAVVVFDGTWPFEGFLSALISYGKRPKVVWSSRSLVRNQRADLHATEQLFDLVIEPGELGAEFKQENLAGGLTKVVVPPVCLLREDEILDRAASRQALGLPMDTREVLFSLGAGNLKDVSVVGAGLVCEFRHAGFNVSWAVPSISTKAPELPLGIKPLEIYPLAKYLRAFDAFVGAAGYNTCCEVVQAGVPSLLVPNDLVVDDQQSRAMNTGKYLPCVVSACASDAERTAAVQGLLALVGAPRPVLPELNGADLAAEAILGLVTEKTYLPNKNLLG